MNNIDTAMGIHEKEILKGFIRKYGRRIISEMVVSLDKELYEEGEGERLAKREKARLAYKEQKEREEREGLELIRKLKPGMIIEVRGASGKYREVEKVNGDYDVQCRKLEVCRKRVETESGIKIETFLKRGKYITNHLRSKIVRIVDNLKVR